MVLDIQRKVTVVAFHSIDCSTMYRVDLADLITRGSSRFQATKFVTLRVREHLTSLSHSKSKK